MPTPQGVHIDQLLSNVALKFANRRFIAPTLCPIIPVTKDSGIYWVFGKERFEAIDSRRAPKAEAKLVDWAVSTQSYKTEPYALADMLSDEEIANADQLSLETETVELLTDLLLVGYEMRVAAKLADTTVWANGAVGSGAWDTANGDPLLDIETAVDSLIFTDANTIVLSKPAWQAFKRNPNVLAALGSNERKTITIEKARELTGIQNWLIGEVYYNTAKRGKTEVMSRIWADTPWIGYIAERPGRRELSAMYAFRNQGLQAQKEYQRRQHGWWHEVSYQQSEEVVCAEAGYIITGAVT